MKNSFIILLTLMCLAIFSSTSHAEDEDSSMLIFMPAILAACGSGPPVMPTFTNSLTTDPNFSVTQLSPESQIWHDRLISAIEGSIYPSPFNTQDLYGFGRTTGIYIHTMAIAARSTKDPRFIQEIAKSLDHLQIYLKDAWPECNLLADGTLNFVWLHSPNSSLYCGDDHLMDDMLTSASIAYATFALHQNTHLDPSYAQKIKFWIDYLENHYLAKHLNRANTANDYTRVFNKYLTHPYQSSVNFFYYLYRLTNKEAYLTEAQRRAQLMNQTFWQDSVNNHPIVVWRHRILDIEPMEEACQPINYSNYTITYATALSLDNFDFYNHSLMANIANTINKLVLPNTSPQIGLSDYLCGTHSFTTMHGYDITSPGTAGQRDFSQITYYSGLLIASIWQPSPTAQDELYLAYLDAENRTETQLDNGSDLRYFSYPTAMLLKHSDLIQPSSP